MNKELYQASCNVALAALLHDLGKIAERARIEVDRETLEGNFHLYCPFHQDGGWFSHKHAAYTAIGIDALESYLPKLDGGHSHPFHDDDSLINGAACHHRPETPLQWIIATADRLASGFEREEYANYNKAKEKTETGRNHYQARQLSLFEQIRLDEQSAVVTADNLKYRYPLQSLSPDSLFPLPAKEYEPADNASAQKEYHDLWGEFREGLKKIPTSHRDDLPLWLDHFDSLLLLHTHSIPSATAFGTRPDVSLYDHCKAVAALATALWRYYEDRKEKSDKIVSHLKQGSDREEEKFLLVQGDFAGIQNFIFSSGGATNKRAAKILRGRSLYVSLLVECAALRVLEELSLPSTSQIINAAGKFLIVAPNTPDTVEALEQVQKEFDDWFLRHTYGVSGIVLARTPASSRSFVRGGDKTTASFSRLMEHLFQDLEARKLQRFSLCDLSPSDAVLNSFLDKLDGTMGLCAVNGVFPAEKELDSDTYVSALSLDQCNIGEYLTRTDRLLIAREKVAKNCTSVPVFGYVLNFVDSKKDIKGKDLVRAYDFSLPSDEGGSLWNGYSRRFINGYVPRFGSTDAATQDRYEEIAGEEEEHHEGDLKTFSHLACEDRYLREDGKWCGISALSVVKGDVDDLGEIFRKGLESPTFAKMAALSRQMNAFFSIYLPNLCAMKFENCYTVFAGGDDFFVVGPWKSQMRLLKYIREDFARYVVNDNIHFSAGISTVKPGIPIRTMAENAEEALGSAKTRLVGKNSVNCYGNTVHWDRWSELLEIEERMARLQSTYGLSTGYLYGLVELSEMAGRVNENPENAIWLSRFVYRSKRFVGDKMKRESNSRKEQAFSDLLLLAEDIRKYGTAFKIPLFNHLYTYR